jgi:cation diffusion facilitator CzcD-associated flavoprotein CzcO
VTSVAIIGSGFGGVAAAVRLLQAGVDDLVVFERSDDVGGVWRANTYPGAACDVPSHLYSFSFAPKPDWSRRFAPQAEIHQYLRDVARDFGVLPHVRFGTEVLSATFDETAARWRLELGDGSTHEADAVVAACGQLSRPSVPAVPGLDTFRGTRFHSAEWDHEHDLTGERVAVIGTGASAIQFVPRIAPRTASLTVFQRSAPYVLPKRDKPYRRIAHAAFSRVPGALKASRWANYWNNEARTLGFNNEPRLLTGHLLHFRRYLRRTVADPALRAKLTPADPMGCKRILISNEWYPALQLPQVELCTDRVVEVREHSVVTADGTEREVDTIVLGTGSRPPTSWSRCGSPDATAATCTSSGPAARAPTSAPRCRASRASGPVRPEHQPGPQLDPVHDREPGGLGRAGRPAAAAGGGLGRRPPRGRGGVRRLGAGAHAEHRVRGRLHQLVPDGRGRNTQNWPASTLTFRRRLRRLVLDDLVLQPAVREPAQAAA